jgi:hypothetical protein
MPSFSYAILQYVPDQARAERINVGVVVVGEGVAFCNARLLKKPQLAQAMRRLGYGRDTGFIEQIRREFDRDAVTGRELPGLGHTAWTVDAVSAASREWANTVQLTTPRPALHADGEVLVEELFVRLVARPRARQVGGRVQHAPRDRRWISHYVLRELRQSSYRGLDRLRKAAGLC